MNKTKPEYSEADERQNMADYIDRSSLFREVCLERNEDLYPGEILVLFHGYTTRRE